MIAHDIDRAAIPLALALFGIAALGVPLARLRVRTGRWAITVMRDRAPVQRLMGVLLAGALASAALFGLTYAMRGSSAVGVVTSSLALHVVGWSLMAAGLGLVVLAQTQMGLAWRVGIETSATDLVTHGIFRWVRNPIYTGMMALLAGLVLAAPGAWTVAMAAVTAAVLSWQTRLEERHLHAMHGEAYRRYAASVGRFVPGVGRWRHEHGDCGHE